MYTIRKREEFMFPKSSVTYFTFSKCNLDISDDQNKFLKEHSKEFIEKCCKTFQTKYTFHPSRYLVDLRPEIWFYIFMKAYDSTSSYLDVKVPNGCCNSIDCPINLFYEIIYDYIKSDFLTPQKNTI